MKYFFLCSLLVIAEPAMHAQRADACPTRQVIVNVVNSQGQRTSGISLGQFDVSTRANLTLTNSDRSYFAPRVLVVLDVSGSMTGDLPRRAARLAIDSLVHSLPTSSEVGLLTFASEPKVRFPFSSDREGFNQAVVGVFSEREWRGQTRLLAALDYATEYIGPTRLGDSIVVISDYSVDNSREDRSPTKRKLARSGVRVFAHLLNTDVHGTPAFGESVLDIAKATGGIAPWGVILGESRNLEESRIRLVSSELAGRVSSGYILTLQFQTSLQDWTKWKVSVRPGRGKERFKVEYPSELAPCVQTEGPPKKT